MEVARLKVSGTYARVVMRDIITAGMAGATIAVEYAPGIWDGLTKTVVFKSTVTKDVITNDNTIKIPPEVLTDSHKHLQVGFYGMDAAEKVIIPTIWADLGVIQPGADPSGDTSTDPSLPIWAQLADRVEDVEKDVEELKQTGGVGPGTPGTPGADGEDGGYYTPAVTQLDDDTVQFKFTPSKPDMPAVNPVTVELPVWQGSGGNVELDVTLTKEGKAADAKAVGDAIAEIGSLEQTNVGVKGWTSGRIESGNHVANSYMAYSEIMPNKRQTIYFDDTKYKLLYIYYDENGNKVGYKGWLTSSPVGIAVDDPYIRVQINALGSTKFTEDILNDLPNQITWPEYKYPISETVANLEKTNFARYVDGANGDDNNPGTAEAPFATIQAGVNSGAKTLYIAPGDYAESVIIQGRDELTILPTAYPEDYDIASPDTPMIHITGGEDKTIGRAMMAENCGKVNITGVWGDNTIYSAFSFFNVKSLTMTGCWASNSGNSENTFNLVNTNAAFYRCKAWNSARDGFGCTKHGDVRLYDCVAHDCADDGVSHHNSCTGIVSGGEFYNNGKGGVSSPTYGAHVDVTGVYSHDNAYGLYTTNEKARRESVGRVNGNVFLNNTTADMLIGSNCRITGWQNIYQTQTGSGTYSEIGTATS